MVDKKELKMDIIDSAMLDNKAVRVPTASGEFYKKKYHLEVNALGVNELVEEDEPFDWYGMIQASTEGCSMDYLLKRFQQTGDISILQKTKGQYFDSTDMPKDLLGMYKKVQEGERYFNQLPLEVRQQFDNSFTKFLASEGVSNVNISNNVNNVNTDSVDNSSKKIESEVNENDK